MKLYWATRAAARALLKTAYRLKVEGAEHVPASGPVIIATNHRSYFDPPVVAVSTTRRLNFFAKKELFAFAPFGRYISALGAFPVERGRGDMAAMRHTLSLLKAGEAVLIFPEGGRNTDGSADAKDGVAFIARVSGATVVPGAIVGTDATKRFGRIRMVFGEPMRYDPARGKDHAALAQWRDELMTKIEALKAPRTFAAGAHGGSTNDAIRSTGYTG